MKLCIPPSGNSASLPASAISSTMPSQKSGIAYSTLTNAVEDRSNLLPRFQPPRMPIHTPITVDSTVDVPTSSTVGHSAWPISCDTGSWLTNERPRLPCAVWTR